MKKALFARLALVSGVTAAAAGSAMAEVPAVVTTALTALQADALTVAGIVLAAIVAVYAFKFIRKGL
ncbi:major capsid protein [Rhodoferax ferrireducens]|uniref:major capsid protein n=1 Tax=Rhodoferax ferrireducens TaxID=192843 RepID=UPI000E0DA606|nr:major capsid protein [Rhodoferax ferrireducens]